MSWKITYTQIAGVTIPLHTWVDDDPDEDDEVPPEEPYRYSTGDPRD